MHMPIRVNLASAHAHATAQHALDITAALRKTQVCSFNLITLGLMTK